MGEETITAVAPEPMTAEADMEVEKSTKSPEKAVTTTALIENKYAATIANDNDVDDDDDDVSVGATTTTAVAFSPELLKMYYSRLFPFDMLYSWLCYESNSSSSRQQHRDSKIFSHREFSFTIALPDGEEIFNRYRSFSSSQDLKEAALKSLPRKIDIGAVFSHAPKDRKAVPNFAPVQRELVFDIDLTDYDAIRRCGCREAKICKRCWSYMTVAVKVMDRGLREDFGYRHIAWIFSGRRGVHAWVCDESARMLSNEARSAVATYYQVTLDNERDKTMAVTHPLHPSIAKAYETLEPMFIKMVLPATGHGLLATPEACRELLETLPASASAVKDSLERKWVSDASKDVSTPAEKWSLLQRHLSVAATKGTPTKRAKTTVASSCKDELVLWPVRTVLKHAYPRLDINVSKMQNHLLKSPFCVHPKTGMVCVPIDANTVDDFDPFTVPTLGDLENELNQVNGEMTNNPWQTTRLKEYYGPFLKNFLDPMIKELRQKERDAGEKSAALVGDF